jgi:hypothetical protein
VGASPICASDIPNDAFVEATTKVAVQCQLIPARDGVALHDRHHGERIVLDEFEDVLDWARRAGGALPQPLAQVQAGAEHRSVRAQHEYALLRRRLLAERGCESVEHLRVQRVALLWAVQRDRSHGAVRLYQHLLQIVLLQ